MQLWYLKICQKQSLHSIILGLLTSRETYITSNNCGMIHMKRLTIRGRRSETPKENNEGSYTQRM